MYIYICTHLYIFTKLFHSHVHIYSYVHTCIYTNIYMYICIYINIYTHAYTHTCMCLHTRTFKHTGTLHLRRACGKMRVQSGGWVSSCLPWAWTPARRGSRHSSSSNGARVLLLLIKAGEILRGGYRMICLAKIVCVCIYMYAYFCACLCVCVQTQIYTDSYLYKQMYTDTYVHIHPLPPPPPLPCAHTHTHINRHKCRGTHVTRGQSNGTVLFEWKPTRNFVFNFQTDNFEKKNLPCPVSHSYAWYESVISYMYVTWLIHMCMASLSHMYVTWPIRICVTWLMYRCKVALSHVWMSVSWYRCFIWIDTFIAFSSVDCIFVCVKIFYIKNSMHERRCDVRTFLDSDTSRNINVMFVRAFQLRLCTFPSPDMDRYRVEIDRYRDKYINR